jgi:hypothetical protein
MKLEPIGSNAVRAVVLVTGAMVAVLCFVGMILAGTAFFAAGLHEVRQAQTTSKTRTRARTPLVNYSTTGHHNGIRAAPIGLLGVQTCRLG